MSLFQVTIMNVRPIRTKSDHHEAKQRIDAVWDAKPKSPKADEREVLCLLVEEYEKKHVGMPKVPPVSLPMHVMEARQ